MEAFSRLKRFVLAKGGYMDKEIESNVWERLMDSDTLEDINIHAVAWQNWTDVPGLEARFPTALKNFSCNEDRWFFLNL